MSKRPKCKNTGFSENYLMVTSDCKEAEAIIYMKTPISSDRILVSLSQFHRRFADLLKFAMVSVSLTLLWVLHSS